jgi:hypothetical protein
VGSALGVALGGVAAHAIEAESHARREARDTLDEIGMDQAVRARHLRTAQASELGALHALREDHAILGELVDGLALFAATIVDATPAAKDRLDEASSLLIRYLQNFHLDEERIVLQTLLRGDDARLARLARDHDDLYALLATVRATCRLSHWDENDVRVLRKTTQQLREAVSDHVIRTETADFLDAESGLTDELAREVAVAIANFENKRGSREGLRCEARALAAR